MIFGLNLFLFAVTIFGGLLPVIYSKWSDSKMNYLLTFSGAYLLSVNMLHLIPESAEVLGFEMGLYLLIGFFLQQVLQRFTHGVEHGHTHIGHGHRSLPVVGLIIGMSVHALGEGIPLGAIYYEESTTPALYLAIALHKLPEAMLIASLLMHNKQRKTTALAVLAGFALLSPASSLLTHCFGLQTELFAHALPYVIATVAGSFLHIGTTIFYESGNTAHAISWRKWLTTIAAIGLALLTTLGNHQHIDGPTPHIHNHSH